MKVKELLEVLKDYDPEMEVKLECDHGQQIMSADWVGQIYVEDIDEYMTSGIHEDDLDNWDDPTAVVLIQA